VYVTREKICESSGNDTTCRPGRSSSPPWFIFEKEENHVLGIHVDCCACRRVCQTRDLLGLDNYSFERIETGDTGRRLPSDRSHLAGGERQERQKLAVSLSVILLHTFCHLLGFLENPMTTSANPLQDQPRQALLEITLMNAESSDANFDDVVIESLKRDIPAEIVTRLAELWSQTKVVAGEVIAVGKIIVRKIVDFLLANPKLTIGIAVGAALTVLVSGIPFIGPLIAPMTATLSTLYGAGVGAAMQKGDYSLSPYSAAIELAHKFFELFTAIFNGISEYWSS
jgi:hypothetical protein